MRIIHCADLHLDSPLTSVLSEEKAIIRRQELLDTFSRMVSFAADNDVNAVIIAGDLFDSAKVSGKAADFVFNKMREYPKIIFYYLKGNHDEFDLSTYGDLLPENLRTFDGGWTKYRTGVNNNIVICGTEDYAAPPKLDNNDFNIVVLHGDTVYDSLADKGIDYVAMGHIHSFRQKKLDSRGIYCYPGCLEGRGFDECGEHGFVIIDIDDRSLKPSYDFKNIACRNIHLVRIDVTGCSDAFLLADKVRESIAGTDIPKIDMIRVELCGIINSYFDKNIPGLEKIFSDKYFAFEIKDLTVLGTDYTEYMNSKSLKGEFVRLVMNSEELSKEDKAEIIRIGINALKGEDINL